MADAEVRWFRSKVDWWLGLLLVLLPLMEFGALARAVSIGDSAAVATMSVACGLIVAIYGLLVVPVRYGVSRDRLIIRFGVVRRCIALDAIREVHPTHNPLSSPALSLDRLAIRAEGGLLGTSLISPAERDEFLSLLAARSGLARAGDRLVRLGDTSA